MKRVYLAVDNVEDIVSTIQDLTGNVEIIHLKNVEDIRNVKDQEFRLLITSRDMIEIDKWPLVPSNKKDILVIDNEKKLDIKNRTYIQVCNQSEVKNKVIEILLSNNKIVPNTTTQDNIVEKKEVLLKQEQEEANKFKAVNMENYPMSIIDELKFLRSGSRSEEKIIGVWSPHSAGTTTFVISFALFMRKLMNRVGVVEIPHNPTALYDRLSRYGSLPENWCSYYESFTKGIEALGQFKWEYRGILWYPAGPVKPWEHNEQFIASLLLKAKQHNNLVFLDIPSQLNYYAQFALKQVDELWVLMDEREFNEKKFKSFLNNKMAKQTGNLPKLIYVGEGKVSQKQQRGEKVAENLEIPLLGKLPYLDRQIRDHIAYEDFPPLDNPIIKRAYENVFLDLAIYLLGDPKEVIHRYSRTNPAYKYKEILSKLLLPHS
jgi:hypothetical protein